MKKIISIIVTLLIFISFLLFNSEKTLATVSSPDSSFKIMLKYKEPLLKGPFKVSIYYKRKNSILKNYLVETMIFHDGSSLSKNNYSLKWKGNTAELTLIGDTKPYEIILINIEEIDKVKRKVELPERK